MAAESSPPPPPTKVLHVTAEAGCLNNGAPAAIGGYQIYFGAGDYRNICVVPILEDVKSTNNRSHLHALLQALIICIQTCDVDVHICIRTCSKITVCLSIMRTCLACIM